MPERWRALLVGYLVWLIALTIVEGLGRETCRMPTRKWIAAATDTRDRTMRDSFRERAIQCLDDTAWYAATMRALVVVAVALPFAALWLVRRRRELVRGAAMAGALGVTVGSIVFVRWLYDWMA